MQCHRSKSNKFDFVFATNLVGWSKLAIGPIRHFHGWLWNCGGVVDLTADQLRRNFFDILIVLIVCLWATRFNFIVSAPSSFYTDDRVTKCKFGLLLWFVRDSRRKKYVKLLARCEVEVVAVDQSVGLNLKATQIEGIIGSNMQYYGISR